MHVADEDRYAMEALADLLRDALDRKVLTAGDLYTTEPEVLEKLRADRRCAQAWARFRSLSKVLVQSERPLEEDWLSVPAKKRWIDPVLIHRGRISRFSPETRAMQEEFLALDFSVWLKGVGE